MFLHNITHLKSNWWRGAALLSAAFFILICLSSCKKEDSAYGLEGIDQNALLNSIQVDTFELQTSTQLDDSIITDNPAYAVLGSYNDPKFGFFNAGFCTQLRLSGENPNFGDISSITIDSLVLGLEYAGYYGDLSSQVLEVFQLNDTLGLETTYYSFTSKSYAPYNLVESGEESFVPNPDGITVIGEDTVDTQLRIPLKKSFATALLQEASSGSGSFLTNEAFSNYFKGLYVRVNNPNQLSGKGGVFYFNLNDPLSKMTLYYTQNNVKKTFDFLINENCADFNKVVINNTGKPVDQVVNNPGLGQSEFYSQAFKSRAVIKIPGMKNLPKRAVIHRADLILPIQYQTGSKYLPSDELSVLVKIDNQFNGIGVFGLYDPFKKYYKVDIRNYLQALVAGSIETTDLFVSPRYFVISSERVIFNGPSSINKLKPKLIVTYTQY